MRIAVIAAVIVAVVGCGASSAGTSPTQSTELRISYFPDGRSEGDRTLWTLRCEPAGGTLAKPGTACQKLEKLKNPFTPFRKDLQCTEIYGGPEQALITGTHDGRRVWVLLGRRNGCEIARWRKLAFLMNGMGSGSGGAP